MGEVKGEAERRESGEETAKAPRSLPPLWRASWRRPPVDTAGFRGKPRRPAKEVVRVQGKQKLGMPSVRAFVSLTKLNT